LLALLVLLSCESEPAGPAELAEDSGGDCEVGADADGDGLDECDELALGTDPASSDTDGDGTDDGVEWDCGADPLDAEEVCYACGWQRRDPGDLEATGADVGDTIENLVFVDQCGEEVQLWDFAEEYHILWMTAAW